MYVHDEDFKTAGVHMYIHTYTYPMAMNIQDHVNNAQYVRTYECVAFNKQI